MKKKKRRNLPKLRNSQSLFSEYVLSKDAETAKYLKHDRVSFPTLSSTVSLESLWISGLFDEDEKNARSVTMGRLTHKKDLPLGTVLPSAARKINEIFRTKENTKVKQEFILNINSRRDFIPPTSNSHKRRLKPLKNSYSMYYKENRQINKAVKSKFDDLDHHTSFQQTVVRNLVLGTRTEKKAAFTIQRFFKISVRAKLMTRKLVNLSRAATVMQKYIRRFIYKTAAERFRILKIRKVILLQSVVRSFFSRRRTIGLVYIETKRAIRIQKCIRGYFGRLRARFFLLHRSATTIQRVFRGRKGRDEYDWLILNAKVVLIQKNVRRFLVRVVWDELIFLLNTMANKIQRIFRGFMAKIYIAELLFAREVKTDKEQLVLLEYETSFLQKKIKRLKTIADFYDTKQLKKSVENLHQNILEKERSLINLHKELVQILPRDVERGWWHELQQSIKEHRASLTALKFSYLFFEKRQLLESEAKNNEYLEELSNLEAKLQRLDEEKDQIVLSLREKVFLRDRQMMQNRRRKDAGAEKRRWRLKTKLGHVDALPRAFADSEWDELTRRAKRVMDLRETLLFTTFAKNFLERRPRL
eukprot:snap_masked-scaffold_2-processed-gene-12.33-mRNA-1 protein AED:1.00 eAED:1.00 QI:0/0/0/0/1/1/2/0/586